MMLTIVFYIRAAKKQKKRNNSELREQERANTDNQHVVNDGQMKYIPMT
jgi:hypothetical protein